MRFVRKMMNLNPHEQQKLEGQKQQKQEGEITSSINNVRFCSICCTTKTPLWRTGPHGPKVASYLSNLNQFIVLNPKLIDESTAIMLNYCMQTLCNACGIRQRKARKAIDTQAMNGDNIFKLKGSKTCNASTPCKKRCTSENRKKKIALDDFGNFCVEQKAGFYPPDEKEAAILLMALSCDLICG